MTIRRGASERTAPRPRLYPFTSMPTPATSQIMPMKTSNQAVRRSAVSPPESPHVDRRRLNCTRATGSRATIRARAPARYRTLRRRKPEATGAASANASGEAYSLAKFGIAAFAESLRQELVGRRVRVSVVEPGTVDTELVTHLREDVRAAAQSQVSSIEPMQPDDIAGAVAYIVTRHRRIALNEILIRAAEQTC